MSLITIDAEQCKRDGVCVATCPFNLLIMDAKDKPPTAREGADGECLRCGHCVAVCPNGALTHQDMAVEECAPYDATLQVTADQARQMFRMRRSIRAYKDKKIPKDLLGDLLRTATYAPSGHNVQPTNWLVVYEADEVARLRDLTLDALKLMLEQNPDFAAKIHVPEVIEATEAGQDMIFRGAPHILLCHAPIDERTAPMGCVIALAHLELAFTTSSLGACWCGYFNYASEVYPPLQEALDLPEGHKNYGALAFGYPRFKYHRAPLRRTPRVTWR